MNHSSVNHPSHPEQSPYEPIAFYLPGLSQLIAQQPSQLSRQLSQATQLDEQLRQEHQQGSELFQAIRLFRQYPELADLERAQPTLSPTKLMSYQLLWDYFASLTSSELADLMYDLVNEYC